MIHGYRIVTSTSGRRWAVSRAAPTNSTIYVEIPGDHKGLGGDSLTFLLDDGAFVELKGPWISNLVSLYEDTGIAGETDIARAT